MHELSIAIALVEAVEEFANERDAASVEQIRLRIGTLAGVEPDALEFSFGVARTGTALAGAALIVETVPARARCRPCDREFTVDSPPFLLCPHCDGASVELLAGRELELASVSFIEREVTDRVSSR